MSRFKSLVKNLLPGPVVTAYRRHRLEQSHLRNRAMTTESVFTEIYAKNLWGGQPGTYCSGSGSREATIVEPYVAAVSRELARLGSERLGAVDLGCGDFVVGRQLAPLFARYVGVDIVKSLVQHHNETSGSDRIAFSCIDIVTDELPAGDVCFVRQVLQHLSNAQIQAVVSKLEKFRFTFITEHQPTPSALVRSNIDKPHGGDIRIHSGSGVFLDQPPFDVPRERLRLLLEVPGHAFSNGMDPGVIRTFVLQGGDPH